MNNLQNYFQKIDNFINLNSNILDNLKLGKLITEFASPTTLLEYYIIEDIDYILSQHTRKICKINPTFIIYAQITGKGLLGAHIDHGPLVTLNFYLEAAKDVTHFFEKGLNATGEIYPGQEEANIFDIRDLQHIGNFVAESNESFLLNVSKIHAVEKVTDDRRSFISYAWHYNTYEEILENLY